MRKKLDILFIQLLSHSNEVFAHAQFHSQKFVDVNGGENCSVLLMWTI